MSKRYIVILLALAFALPLFADIVLTQNFDGVTPPTLPAGWLVRDYNLDGKTWALTTSHPRSLPNCFRYNYNRTVAAKDWFFSNGVTLQGGITYTLEFFYDASNPTFPEALRVWLTTAQDSSSKVGGALWNNASIMNTVFAQGLVDFTPASTQTYYLGFECYSPMNMWNLRVDDITIYKDVHDVGVEAIVPPPSPGQVYTLNSIIIPKIVVHNWGQNTGGEYTPVHVEVVGLPSSVEWFRDTMIRLEICTPETLTFPPCTLKVPCNHRLSAWTALSNDQNRHNDTMSVDFLVNARDVQVYSIVIPRDTILWCTESIPTDTVRNLGHQTESFWVYFKSLNNLAQLEYFDSTYVSALPSGSKQRVTFKPFHPEPCNHTAISYTAMPGDENIHNDTVTKPYVIKYYDVSADSIYGVKDTITLCNTIYDTVVIRNRSVHILSQTGKVYINYIRNAVVLKSDSATGITLAADERKAIPFSYHPDSSCNWSIKAWVVFPFDANPANDTARKNFVVRYYDVSADSIYGVKDTITLCNTIYDTVVIRNRSVHIVSQTGKVYINYYRNTTIPPLGDGDVGGWMLMKSDSATGITLAANERKTIPFSYHPDSSCNWLAKAWVSFPFDQNPANDTVAKNFVVKYYDVSADSILGVKDTITLCNTIYDTVVIRNRSVHILSQTGKVYVNYIRNAVVLKSDSATGITLAANERKAIPFSYHPDSTCNWSIKAWVVFPFDANPANDTARKNFVVRYYDVSADSIYGVKDTITLCNTIYDTIVIRNRSVHIVSQTGKVYVNYIRNAVVLKSDSATGITLAANERKAIPFSYHPDSTCNWSIKAWVVFPFDANPANDTVKKNFVVKLTDLGISYFSVIEDTIEWCNTVKCSVAIRNNSVHSGPIDGKVTIKTYRNSILTTNTATFSWPNIPMGEVRYATWTFHPESACNWQAVAICSTAIDNNPLNDTAKDNFVVTWHDVEAVSLLNVPDTLQVGEVIHAKFVVHNNGIHVPLTTGWVHFNIYRRLPIIDYVNPYYLVYSDSVQKTLAYCVYDTVPFTWTADSFCDHKVVAYVAYSPDQNRHNDTLSQLFVVRYRDVQVTNILVPKDIVHSCSTYTPAIVVRNNGIHAGPALCTLNLKIWRYKVKLDSLCHISPDTTTAIVAYDQSVVITIYPSSDTTIYMPQWHPYWSDIYWVGQHHHMTATIHMPGDQNSTNDSFAKNFVVKAHDHDLQMNYVGLLRGNTPVTNDTVIVGVAYNPVSVVSNSPEGPTAFFRTWYKVYRIKDGVVVYSRYLDKTLLAGQYACLYYQSGWVPTDSGFYTVSSWIQTRPGVDLLPENDSMQRTFYARLTTDKGNQQGERVYTLPTTFALQQNFPNPTFRTTAIRWQIPSASDVAISIYDASGRNIKTLVNGKFVPGYYSTIWNCTNEHNQKVSAGIYFYEMRTTNYTSRLKMVIAH
jgi:hypothetical protein